MPEPCANAKCKMDLGDRPVTSEDAPGAKYCSVACLVEDVENYRESVANMLAQRDAAKEESGGEENRDATNREA